MGNSYRGTDYCDHHQLTTRQPLKLLVPVCQAVQHGHGKGVIHRDLKPTNVLVMIADGRPVPKVIDFGVAKAAQSKNVASAERVMAEVGRPRLWLVLSAKRRLPTRWGAKRDRRKPLRHTRCRPNRNTDKLKGDLASLSETVKYNARIANLNSGLR